VDYTDQNVAHQIENAVLPCLNSIVADMKIFLQVGLGIDAERVSPFARSFADFNDLAVTYYSYLPEKLGLTSKTIHFLFKNFSTVSTRGNASELDSIDEMDLNENEVNDLFDNVVKFVLQQDEEDERNPDASSFMIPLNRL